MLATILLEAAGKIAAPVIKKILADKIGGAGGDLAGKVIDAIAEKAGVPPEQLPTAPNLPEAIAAAEPEAVELLAAHVESQRLMNETLKAEMDKDGPLWTWAWRPFGMWMFLGLVPYYAIVVPLLNVVMAAPLALVLDVPSFVALLMFYAGFYMGGHTAKAAVESWRKAKEDK